MTGRRLAFVVALLVLCAPRAHAALSFQNPLDGAVITQANQLPIAIVGTHTGASVVFLQIQQDPALPPPPNGVGGATVPVSTTLNGNVWQTPPMYLLNGSYRLTVQSNVDLPISIDITVAIPGNPGFVDCVTDPGGLGVQTRAISWNPVVPIGAPAVNVNMSRAANVPTPELLAAPTFYAAGTPFVCTQATAGHVPRVLIFGADPVLDTNAGFSGWSYDANTTALTAKMETVPAFLPDGTSIASTIAGLFALYDDDAQTPGLLPQLTGSWFAANGQFSLIQLLDANGKTIAL